MSPNQSAGLMQQMIWKEMCQQLGIEMMMCVGRLQLTGPILSTASWAAQEPNTHQSCLSKSPSYTVSAGKLPYELTQDSIKNFFRV